MTTRDVMGHVTIKVKAVTHENFKMQYLRTGQR